MMTNTIKTYFRIKNEFISIDHLEDTLPNEFHIDGAIVCRIDGREILGMKHWDLVDQLWAYIVQGLQELDAGRDYETYFPDQPLLLKFEAPAPDRIRVSIGQDSSNVDAATFRKMMKHGAMDFFSKMKKICPSAMTTWQRYQKEAEMLEE